MKINSIKLKNFRCYAEQEFILPEDYAIILGDNGSGKTAILEALVIGMGSIFLGIDGIKSKGVQKTDARLKCYQLGSARDVQPQYPVEIVCSLEDNGLEMTFKRELRTENGSTTRKDAQNIIKYYQNIQNEVRGGNKQELLPIISYYSTARLWLHERKKSKNSMNKLFYNKADKEINKRRFNRFNGYIDCLSTKTNEKLMLSWFKDMELIQFQRNSIIPELNVVKEAIAEFFISAQDYELSKEEVSVFFDALTSQLLIVYKDRDYNEVEMPFDMLSDGYRGVLSMVADIAYRMAILNPQLLEDTLKETTGVVLIDEVDLHLHPKWQQRIVQDLKRVFPKVQFIITTHSANVILNIPKENIIIIEDNEPVKQVPNTKGRDIASLMYEVMGVKTRTPEAELLIREFYNSLEDEDYKRAKLKLEQMRKLFGENDKTVIDATIEYELEVEGGIGEIYSKKY